MSDLALLATTVILVCLWIGCIVMLAEFVGRILDLRWRRKFRRLMRRLQNDATPDEAGATRNAHGDRRDKSIG